MALHTSGSLPATPSTARFDSVSSVSNAKSVNNVKSVKAANKLPRLELLVVLAVEVALVVAVHLAGGPAYAVPLDGIGDWLQTADPTVALVALARLAALAIGYWLLATTVLYAAAHHLGWHALTGALRWITLPFIRRVVHGVTALSLTSASLLGPAALGAAPALAHTEAVTLVVDVGADAPDTTSVDTGAPADQGTAGTSEDPGAGGFSPDAAGWPGAEEGDGFWRPDAVTQGLSAAATTYTVAAQDNLWQIAETHLRQTAGRDVTEDEVAQYWRRVVDANRSSVSSGDPNLIYPDEHVTLPPVFSE